MPYTLPTLLNKNSKGENKEENISELKKDLLLAVEE